MVNYGLFLARNRSLFMQTFVVVLVTAIIVTLFTTPIYRATARILLPTNESIEPSASRMGFGSVLDKVKNNFAGTRPLPKPIEIVDTKSNSIDLAAESDNPEVAQVFANLWADQYRQVNSGSTAVIKPAGLPGTPIRPKKEQNIIFGGLAGLLAGFILSGLREMFGSKSNNVIDLEAQAFRNRHSFRRGPNDPYR